MLEALKQIEEKHLPYGDHPGCPEHQQLGDPCDVVKLARALARLAYQDECGCDDHLSSYCCATVEPGACPTCEAERTLKEVAGE